MLIRFITFNSTYMSLNGQSDSHSSYMSGFVMWLIMCQERTSRFSNLCQSRPSPVNMCQCWQTWAAKHNVRASRYENICSCRLSWNSTSNAVNYNVCINENVFLAYFLEYICELYPRTWALAEVIVSMIHVRTQAVRSCFNHIIFVVKFF